jgi:hypothetical protein
MCCTAWGKWSHQILTGFLIPIPTYLFWTTTHSSVYFYYFLYCRITLKISQLWNNTHGIM